MVNCYCPVVTHAYVLHDVAGQPVALVEVRPSEDHLDEQLGALRTSMTDRIAKLENIGSAIAVTCRDILEATRRQLAAAAPDEFEITFGVAVSTEGGYPLSQRLRGRQPSKYARDGRDCNPSRLLTRAHLPIREP